jgi:hypothetical protein
MRMPRAFGLLALLVVVAVTPVATASAKSYDLPTLVAPHLAGIKAHTTIPVLLPNRLSLDHSGPLYVRGGATSREWMLNFLGSRSCVGTGCFLGAVTGELGGPLDAGQKVKLRGGITGHFAAVSCTDTIGPQVITASVRSLLLGAIDAKAKAKAKATLHVCGPPSLQFKRKGVLYNFQAKVADSRAARAELVRAANQAMAAGPR